MTILNLEQTNFKLSSIALQDKYSLLSPLPNKQMFRQYSATYQNYITKIK